MSRRYATNIYDTSYIELTLETGLPLAKRDDAGCGESRR